MKDHYYTALADERRRDLLASIREDQSHRVDTREHDPGESETRLHHVHLPMLEDAGLVRWDREADRIVRGQNYEEIEPLIEFLGTRSNSASD